MMVETKRKIGDIFGIESADLDPLFSQSSHDTQRIIGPLTTPDKGGVG
jgi:hypothetical protein